MHIAEIQGGPKIRDCFLISDYFATTDDRKACNMSKSFRILSIMKCIICMSVQLNILCLISSGLNICVRDRPCFTVFWMKIEQNSCTVKFNTILRVLTIYAN